MVKSRTIFITLAAMLCSLAVIGTGLASWVFNKDTRKDLSFKVLISQSSAAGTFKDYSLPVYAVVDGISGVDNSVAGISFYKSGSVTINGVDCGKQYLADTDLSVSFEAVSDSVDFDELEFGLQIKVVGPLADYLAYTSAYSMQPRQKNAHGGDFIDLKNITPYQVKDNVITFNFTTTLLGSFFTLNDDMQVTDKSKYDLLLSSLTDTEETSAFEITLWQGRSEVAND